MAEKKHAIDQKKKIQGEPLLLPYWQSYRGL